MGDCYYHLPITCQKEGTFHTQNNKDSLESNFNNFVYKVQILWLLAEYYTIGHHQICLINLLRSQQTDTVHFCIERIDI